MGSRCLFPTCLVSGFLLWGAALSPVWAAQGTSASKASVTATASELEVQEPGLLTQLSDFFHRLVPTTTSAVEEAPAQPGRVAALTPEQREQMRDQIRQQWQSASPEERQKRREEFHERWESATPEQQDQMRERVKERWEQLSPEQRQQIRQHIEDRSGRPSSPGPGH